MGVLYRPLYFSMCSPFSGLVVDTRFLISETGAFLGHLGTAQTISLRYVIMREKMRTRVWPQLQKPVQPLKIVHYLDEILIVIKFQSFLLEKMY